MRSLKSVLLLSLFLLAFPSPAAAEEYAGTITFSPDDLNLFKANGFDYAYLKDAAPNAPVGAPVLPVVQADIAVPWDAEILGVFPLHVETVALDGEFDIVPMTQPKHVSQGQNGNPFLKDPLYYGQNAFLPGAFVEYLNTWTMVGQRLTKIAFHPLQYNPTTRKLALATRIDFQVIWNKAAIPPERQSANLSNSGKAYYESLLKHKILNPEAVSIPQFAGAPGRALPPGQYDHVIITPATYEYEWDLLRDWRTQKGHPSTVVTKEYIYANYSGSSNQKKIRNFVQDAQSTWGARYFLIGADGGSGSNEVPYHEKYLLGEDVPNDTYYADFGADYVVDVHIGRASVTSTSEIDDFITKVLTYEKNPPLTDYGKKVFFMGFDLDSKTPGETTKEYIRTSYLPGYLTFLKEYDSEWGSHLGDVIDYMNDGPNLVNHIDHCNWYVWGMGYVNHGGGMYDTDVNSLTNGWRLMNFYTLGCLASAWQYSESISETFMRKTGNAGVSFTGNTCYGWYNPGLYDTYSSLYDIRWWHVLFTDNQYHVGETLSAHKNDYWPDDEYYEYIFMELNLLGDPAMPLWKDDPSALTVTCDDPIYTGSQSYTVNVQEGGSDLEDALVCLWKDSEIYESDTTDSSGDADFVIDPLTAGTLSVTVTAQECLPHEGSVTVIEGGPPELKDVTPDDGGVAGGTPCTLIGSNFTTTPDTTVTFGGATAASVAVVDSSTITCDSPAHGAGTVDVTVTNSNGSDTLVGAFTYHDPPSIGAVSPDNGSPLGGTAVTVTGSDFSSVGTTSVTFGGAAAIGVSVVNATTITCTTPAHGAGSVDVVVTNDFGSDTLNNGFTYNDPPSLSSIAPTDGPVAGGTAVTISGDHFTTTPDTSVTFGGTAASGVTVVDANTITCTTPAHGAGSVDVTVTNSNGSDTLVGAFTYHNPPSLSDVDPDNGPPAGGTPVTITGSDFTTLGSTSVTFDGLAATGVAVVNTTTITCTTPAHGPGMVDVAVTNEFGSDTLTNGFTYNNPPSLTSIDPEHGATAGGTPVTISGDDFTSTADTSVTFDGITASGVNVVDANTITCTTPAHGAGSVDVTVSNNNGSDTLVGAFTYHNPPAVMAVDPDNGPAAGGTAVTVTGSDFALVGSTSVTFGGTAATSVTVVNTTTITCTTPAHGVGLVDVVVTNDFGSGTLSNGYTYNNPPSLASVSPTDGPVAGGTAVTISGDHFTTTPDTSVTFGGTAASGINVVNATTITCTTPAHGAGAKDVTVTNSNGSDTLTGAFTYHDAPSLSAVDPDNGSPAGGTPVTITGTDFTTLGTISVTFDGLAASGVNVVNATTITCATPAHGPGAVDVVVTNDFGSDTLVNGYTYNNPPSLSDVDPDDGPIAGGTAVTIIGNYFTTTADTLVTFDGTAASGVNVVDANTITCTTPAHGPGAVDVTVTNSNGSDTLVGAFTYHNPPSVAAVNPDNGTPLGGTPVTITGSDFALTGSTSVTFGGTAATGVTVVDTATITCTTPAHGAGLVDVVVTNDFGSGTLSNGYTYNNPPSLASVSPTDGPVAGGTAVTISGDYFTTTPDTSVTFGGTAASGITVVDANTITCTTPAHGPGSVDVTVTNSNGSDTLTGAFTYHDAPSLSAVDPDNGSPAGGTPVTITGTDFTAIGTTSVTFDGLAASGVNVVNSTTITCATPAHGPGDVDVVVTNDFGSDTLVNGFTYNNPPSLSDIDPEDGPIAGGTSVTITGNHFTTTVDTTVTFDGTPATGVNVVNATTITCNTPAHGPGAADVTVTNSNGSDTLTGAFTYHNPPVVTDVDPNNGPIAGGTPVTVTGTGFTAIGSTSVSFGGTAASGITVVNATTITCTTPAHGAGTVDVTVTNDFGSDTLDNGYTYNNPPVLAAVSPEDGPIAGGTSVTLTGNYFTYTADTSVTFDGISATNIDVLNATIITCNTPVHGVGAVDVTVSNSNGSDTLVGAFTYHNPPALTNVAPDNGPIAGGQAVTVTGSGFTAVGTTSVTFGGADATGVTVVDATTITCTTPAHGPGGVDVIVTNDFGSDTLSNGYTYNNPPTLAAVSPQHGPASGGTAVTLTGDYFTSTVDTSVTFDGVSATNVNVVDPTTITCNTPAHGAMTVDVTVTNSNGSDTLAGAFTYHNPPAPTAVNPDNGPQAGGTPVTITGSGFTTIGATSVTFGGAAATGVTVVDASTITCTTPAHGPGGVDVEVSNDFGSGTLVNGFTYNNPPLLSSIDPADGPVAGGTPVTISGSYFTTTADTMVLIGGSSATSIVVVDASTITCNTPAHAAGAVDVTVTNSNGSDTLPGAFTYHNAPAILSVAPDNGPMAGGTPVTLIGEHFTDTGDTTVLVGGSPAANMSVVNATTITFETPASAASGPADVYVANSWGDDTLAGGFTYNPPPELLGITPTSGPIAGGTAVTLTGNNFLPASGTQVLIDGAPAANVVVVDASTITCDTPACPVPDLVDVEVSNANGGDVLANGFELIPPAGAAPMNLTDKDTLNLYPGDQVRLAVTGQPGAAFMLFLSFGGGPINTPFGVMGLDFPVILLWSMNLNANGYLTLPVEMPTNSAGYFNFFTHALVDDAPPVWAVGGNNPNGSGSVKWGLN